MSAKYAEACKEKSLASLLNIATQRERIYHEVMPQLKKFLADQQEKIGVLRIAEHHRAFSVWAASIGNAFSGRNPLVSHYDMGVMPQTIAIQHAREEIANDPRRPMMMQLESK
ncbi:hypothetical protein ACLMJK_009069 [Lecanora helva]